MLSYKVNPTLCASKQLSRAVAPLLHQSTLASPGIRVATLVSIQQHGTTRYFSTTPVTHLRDFFPVKETENIRQTLPSWPHHGYTEQEMLDVVPAHREPQTVGDWAAWKFMRFCRWGMDFFTGMEKEQAVDKKNPTIAVNSIKPLTESQWMIRFIFLESIAGVPGMVAGMLRHLHSIRRLKRDNGWIETLLEESYNERMHLLTFMKMCEPGLSTLHNADLPSTNTARSLYEVNAHWGSGGILQRPLHILSHFPQDHAQVCWLPRRRGCSHVHDVYQADRGRPPAEMVRSEFYGSRSRCQVLANA